MSFLRKLHEMQFQDYKPSAEEVAADIAQTQKSLDAAKSQNNGPMVAKFQNRLDALKKKRQKLGESTKGEKLKKELSDLQRMAKNENDPKLGSEINEVKTELRDELKREIEELRGMLKGAGGAENEDSIRNDIDSIEADLERYTAIREAFEGGRDYKARLKRMSAAQLQAELEKLQSSKAARKPGGALSVVGGDDQIELVRAELKRTRA